MPEPRQAFNGKLLILRMKLVLEQGLPAIANENAIPLQLGMICI